MKLYFKKIHRNPETHAYLCSCQKLDKKIDTTHARLLSEEWS